MRKKRAGPRSRFARYGPVWAPWRAVAVSGPSHIDRQNRQTGGALAGGTSLLQETFGYERVGWRHASRAFVLGLTKAAINRPAKTNAARRK